jgi:hypothetical protein
MSIAALLAWPGVVAAAPGSVAVDTSGLEAVGEELAPEVTAALDALLEREGLDPTSLRVRIIWLDANAFHYSIYASFDRTLPDDQLPIVHTCEGCSKSAVVERTVDGVKKLIPAEKERLAKLEVPPPDDDDDDVVVDVPPADTSPARRQPLQPMGWTGVGLLVSGAALAITGGAFLGVGETRPQRDMSQIRNFRPSGYALLGTGGALLVVGAILLGVDRVRAKKGKPTAKYDVGLLGGRF